MQSAARRRSTAAARGVRPAHIEVPEAAGQAGAPSAVRVESQKLADGVWYLGGASAVEFKDFVAVFEAYASEEMSLAVIAEVKKLAPNKPNNLGLNEFFAWYALEPLACFTKAIVSARQLV